MHRTESHNIAGNVDTVTSQRRSKRHLPSEDLNTPIPVHVCHARTTKKRVKSSETNENTTSSQAAAHFEIGYLLHNPKSCLRTVDLNRILNETTWALLTQSERTKCLGLLPSVDHACSTDGTTNIKPNFFTHNIFLQDAFRDFQNDLQSGYLTTAYAERSLNASRERRQGNADAFKDEQFEQFWGDKQRLSDDSNAGLAVSIKLADLICHHYIREGDIFLYSRNFLCRRKTVKTRTTIRKRCRLVTIDETEKASWRICIASGEKEHLAEDPMNIEADLPISLMTLEYFCLDIDGRVNKHQRTNGNSWKYFRLQRGANDLGSIFELRERLYQETRDIRNKQGVS